MEKNIANIKEDLQWLRLEKGDAVLVHSSLRALYRNGSEKVVPAQVISALRSVLGEEGTLIFPALSYSSCGKAHPFFNALSTPSCVGALPEYFRTEIAGAERSLSPTHSCCAIGAKADYITSGHILDHTPCGQNSPFYRLMEMKGKILFLGCSSVSNTSMHAVEELVRPDYLFGEDVEYTITCKDGRCFQHVVRSHDFRGVTQRYDRLEGLLEEGKGLTKGNVMDAECVVMDTVPMWETAYEAYKKDPHFFIDKNN